MEKSEKLFETIERYLANQLEGRDLANFEEQLKNDKQLRTQVAQHRLLHESLKDKDAITFKKQLVEIGKELEEEKIEKSPLFSSWRIAAGIIVVIGLSLYFYLNSQTSGATLYNQFYSVFPAEELSRGDHIDEKLKGLIDTYRNEDYKGFIENINTAVHDSLLIQQQQLKLYLGNSFLKTGNYKKAVETFQSVDSLNTYFENAQWYLALSYLKLGDKNQARAILERLVPKNGIYTNRASDLLKELE